MVEYNFINNEITIRDEFNLYDLNELIDNIERKRPNKIVFNIINVDYLISNFIIFVSKFDIEYEIHTDSEYLYFYLLRLGLKVNKIYQYIDIQDLRIIVFPKEELLNDFVIENLQTYVNGFSLLILTKFKYSGNNKNIKNILLPEKIKSGKVYTYNIGKEIYNINNELIPINRNILEPEKYYKEKKVGGILPTVINFSDEEIEKSWTKLSDMIFERVNGINTMPLEDENLHVLLEKIKLKYEVDFSKYQFDSFKRRLNFYMKKVNIDDFYKIESYLLEDEKNFEDFINTVSINVTRFFRDSEVFDYFENHLINYLNSYEQINVWSAGCSSGEEAYSIAMILLKNEMLSKSDIYGTDFNSRIVGVAKNGIYPIDAISGIKSYLNDEKIEKTTIINYNVFFQFKDNISSSLHFFKHNLSHDGVFKQFNIIFCRNVLIYFNQELTLRTINIFYESLSMFGFLVLGKSERIPFELKEKFKVIDDKLRIYQKVK